MQANVHKRSFERMLLNGLLSLIVVAVLQASALAQKSQYFVTDAAGYGRTSVLQNGTLQYSFPWVNTGQSVIYIDEENVRQAHYEGRGVEGNEYRLDGTPTANKNYYNNGHLYSYDAAFDGENVYTIAYLTGVVSQYDKDFSNGVALFPTFGGFRTIGITYDSRMDTLWTSEGGSDQVTQWALDGTEVSCFHTGMAFNTALAYDPLDDTLWLHQMQLRRFEQYDRDGNLLSTMPSVGTVFGGEMQVVTDEDGDGVLDADDLCPGTVIPESVPTSQLGINRFALVDGDDVFDSVLPKGSGPALSFTLEDTAGCSCEQMIAEQGLGAGHSKFGCSIGAMKEWIAFLNP